MAILTERLVYGPQWSPMAWTYGDRESFELRESLQVT